MRDTCLFQRQDKRGNQPAAEVRNPPPHPPQLAGMTDLRKVFQIVKKGSNAPLNAGAGWGGRGGGGGWRHASSKGKESLIVGGAGGGGVMGGGRGGCGGGVGVGVEEEEVVEEEEEEEGREGWLKANTANEQEVCAGVCVCVHAHMYRYTHTCTHTHIGGAQTTAMTMRNTALIVWSL